MIYISRNVKETQKIAAGLAKKIIKSQLNETVVIALEGELGAGKTVFVKALAKALDIKEKIKSPTFVLIKKYIIPKTGNYLYHLDCYRLRDEKDLINLDINNILSDSRNIVCIEWSDRIKKIVSKKHMKVHIDHVSETERKITIS